MNKLEIIISSDINNIMMVERFIDGFSERFHVPDYLSARVNLSVIEAVNNAILSGNKRDLNKNVTLIVSIENNRLKVTISDEGDGFDFKNIPDPTLPDNLGKSAGRGLYLMKSLSDDIVFSNGGSTVTMFFNL
ncbi:MAG: ATP-binding protein [Odoribacter sp.]|nr:ATP-binding protein [Odoribacter sp.]